MVMSLPPFPVKSGPVAALVEDCLFWTEFSPPALPWADSGLFAAGAPEQAAKTTRMAARQDRRPRLIPKRCFLFNPNFLFIKTAFSKETSGSSQRPHVIFI
jgi:hypothetical protein